jgi:hypothetical protein
MADKKESAYSTFTPVATDYIRGVDNPGGTPVTGNILISALTTLLGDTFYGVPNVSYVTSDFSKTSDTTLANVTGLTYTTISSGVYRFKAQLLLSCHASGGAKVAISGTNTATAINYLVQLYTLTAVASEANTALDADYGTTAAHVKCVIDGYINVANGGTITVQFAQNASYGTASKVLAGSWFEVDRMA